LHRTKNLPLSAQNIPLLSGNRALYPQMVRVPVQLVPETHSHFL
jgi:hypothetical protein